MLTTCLSGGGGGGDVLTKKNLLLLPNLGNRNYYTDILNACVMRRYLHGVLKFVFLFNVIKFTCAQEQTNYAPKPNFQTRNKYNRRISPRATARGTHYH